MLQNYVGRQIGGFVVEELLTQRSTTAIYVAYQPSIRRQVALKLFDLGEEVRGAAFRQQFAQEARVIAMLEHLHILPIYDYGILEDDNAAYIAMRLMRGGSLGRALETGALPLPQGCDMLIQIAGALQYMHERGVLHRALKPSNILLDEVGNGFLTDFGLMNFSDSTLRMTQAGMAAGALAYIAPEKLTDNITDHRSDIYSLGALLYHIVTGKPPIVHLEGALPDVIRMHLNTPPPSPTAINPTIPPAVEGVVLRALERDPRRRFFSAGEMAQELGHALGRTASRTGVYPGVSIARAPRLSAGGTWRGLGAVVGLFLLIVTLSTLAFLLLSQRQSVLPPPTMTVLEGQGAPGDIVLAAGEIEMARARVGDSFIAYIACTQENDTQIRHIRELNDLFLNHHIRMRVYDSELDSYQQITLIERAHVDGAKAMIVCPLNFELLEEPLRAAQAAGIPLVFTTSAPDGYGVAVDVDSYELGRMAGQLAGQLVRDEHDGDARVILLGQSDVYAQRLRLVGMLDGLRELAPNARVLGEFGGGTRDNGYAEVERLLEQRQQFEVVLAVNDATAYGAIKALEDADYEPGSVDVISMGGEALARDWVADGRFLRATIDVNREISSQTVFNAAIKMLAGGTLPQTVVIPPGEIITQTG